MALRPSTFTVTVTVNNFEEGGGRQSLEITVDDEAKKGVVEWLKENNSHEGFLVITDVDGDVFSYKADTVTNVEIMRDSP